MHEVVVDFDELSKPCLGVLSGQYLGGVLGFSLFDLAGSVSVRQALFISACSVRRPA